MNVLSILPQIIIFVALAGIAVIVIRRVPDLKKKITDRQSGGPTPKATGKEKNKEDSTLSTDSVKRWLGIQRKKLSVWIDTLKPKRTSKETSVNMKADSNIQALQQSEKKLGKGVGDSKKEQATAKKKTSAPKKVAKQHQQKRASSPSGMMLEHKTAGQVLDEAEGGARKKQHASAAPQPTPSVPMKKPKTMPVAMPKPAPPVTYTDASPDRLMQSEKSLIQKIMRNPKDIAAYKELAEVYAQQGNTNDAMKALNEVLKLNPNDLMAEEKLHELDRLRRKKK